MEETYLCPGLRELQENRNKAWQELARHVIESERTSILSPYKTEYYFPLAILVLSMGNLICNIGFFFYL